MDMAIGPWQHEVFGVTKSYLDGHLFSQAGKHGMVVWPLNLFEHGFNRCCCMLCSLPVPLSILAFSLSHVLRHLASCNISHSFLGIHMCLFDLICLISNHIKINKLETLIWWGKYHSYPPARVFSIYSWPTYLLRWVATYGPYLPWYGTSCLGGLSP
jgi:hypothetical protein